MNEHVWKILEDYNAGYVIVDEPKLPIDIRVTTDFAYVRWHGHGIRPWYNYRYSIEELQEWQPRLTQLNDMTKAVVGYFNNHFSGNAPLNALQMLKLMNMATPPQEGSLNAFWAVGLPFRRPLTNSESGRVALRFLERLIRAL